MAVGLEEFAHKICPACDQRVLEAPRFCPNCAADLSGVETRHGDPYVGLVIEERYEIEKCIGVGAMGRVYRARQTVLGKPFAIKILHPHLTHDAESHERFANEAQNAAGLSHPNVVSVVDYGRTKTGVTYLVMEFIEGRSLERILTDDFPLPRERVIDLTLQILAALTEAHGMSILHRDLKPENILVQTLRTRGELLKVLDFGIAKLMDGPEQKRPGLTSQGIVCGTPEYMSPEQARGRPLDGRSDLYAAGVILYRMLTGRLPFSGDSAIELLHRHIHETPIHPAEVLNRSAEPLDELCMCALSKDREVRFSSAAEFRDALVAISRANVNVRSCSTCGNALRANDRFCAGCGTPAPPPDSAPDLPEGAQRTRASLQLPAAETSSRLAQRFPLPTVGMAHHVSTMRESMNHRDAAVSANVLVGQSASGKTRLLDELVREGAKLGWMTVRIGAEPSGAAPPLWPIREGVRKVLNLPPKVTTQDLGRASNLAGLSFEALPGLAELFGLDGPLTSAEFAVRRRETYAASAQTLISAGHGSKLLIVCDEIERWDTSSREVLLAARHQAVGSPVVLWVASREQDLSWFSPNGYLEMGQLGPEAIKEASRYICAGEDGRLAAFLAALTPLAPVDPLTLEFAMRELAVARDLPANPDLQSLLEQRYAAVTPAQAELLATASVLGDRVSERVLRRLVEIRGGPTGDELDELLASLHVEHWLPLSEPGWRRFAHDEVRQFIYRRLDPESMCERHGAAAEAIASTSADPIVEAMHRLRAGDVGMVDSLDRAARHAETAFDDRKAASLLGAALRVLEQDAEHDAHGVLVERRAEMAIRAGKACCFSNQPELGLSYIDAALRLSSLDAKIEAELRRARGLALGKIGRHQEAAKEFAQLAGSALMLGDPEVLLLAQFDYARALMAIGKDAAARQELEQGLDMATMGEGPRAEVAFEMWRYLLLISELAARCGDERGALQYARHAVFRAEHRDNPLAQMRCHAELGEAFTRVGQATRGEQHRTRAIALARDFGDRKTAAQLLLARAEYKLALPRAEEAKGCAESALALATVIEWPTGVRDAQALLERAQAML